MRSVCKLQKKGSVLVRENTHWGLIIRDKGYAFHF